MLYFARISLFIFILPQIGWSQADAGKKYFDVNLNRVKNYETAFCFQMPEQQSKMNDTLFYYLLTAELYAKQWQAKGIFKKEIALYHSNGVLQRSGVCKKGEPIGKTSYFEDTGNYLRTTHYNNRGKIKAVFYLSDSGKTLIAENQHPATFGNGKNHTETVAKIGQYVQSQFIRPAFLEEILEPYISVHFLVDSLGKVQEIELVHALHPSIDESITTIFLAMPTWTPAYFDGQNWYSEWSISINF